MARLSGTHSTIMNFAQKQQSLRKLRPKYILRPFIWKNDIGGVKMANRKKDPSKIGLSSPQVKGQGTTTEETGTMKADASRKKHGR